MGDTEPLSRVVGPRDVRALDLERGRVLDGRYEIRRRIGSGGMGVVYAARRLALGDIVALKQLAPVSDSQYNRSRFLLEARSAAHIRHPNVVEIYDFGNSPDQPPYIVMEYIEGPTLSQVLRRGRLPVARALEIFHPLCSAIEAGHRRGIVHRDLKPANIILATSDDGLEIVKVLDFGLAFVAAGGAERLTQPGSIVGTARYMAPEQARSEDVTPATDIFTLGILLYEMVTGQVPFLAKTPVLTALKISEGEYEPPETLVPSLPRPLVQAITQALRQDPAQRPLTPGELARQAAEGDARSATAVPTKPAGDSLTAAPQADRPADLEALSFDHFVGRERQLRRLREELDHAVRGPGRVVLVVGDPGAGKTRLVEHFTAQIQAEQPAVVLWGRFFDYGGSRRPPYESFINILREGSKGQADDRRIRIATEAAAAGRLDADSGRWRFFTAVTEAFAARAEQGPMILALDDIQWATSADLELIDHLQRSLGHRRTLVVVTARESDTRPESGTELASWILRLGARRAHAQLAVGHFAEGEIRTWLHQGFGGLHIHPRDLKRLATVTGANPYCLVEVTRHLLATGAIDWQDGWRCQPLDDVALPETVANLVRTRLQGLSKGLRQVLETAAVVGAEMRFETLQKATGV
ncbi:MAG: serine/threonine-protein kinase, partial [Acidobacteriota bacterium]